MSSSVLQPHGKHRQFPEPSARLGAGHLAEAYGPRAAPGKTARVGAGGCGPSALQPLRFADDVKDSPSGSKGWCYRELARICQLECVDTFLVMRSLLIAPGGGEAGLIFLALCKSLSAPLCFPFCARASSPDFCPLVQRYRSEEQLSPRHLQTCWGSQHAPESSSSSLPSLAAGAEFLFLAGAASQSQFQGMPSHNTIFPQSGNCSPPPTMGLTCLGLQQQSQPQQVTIQVQEPGDMVSNNLLQGASVAGQGMSSHARGMAISPSANQMQMQHRANLMASLTYGHRQLSKQLSADSAESHR